MSCHHVGKETDHQGEWLSEYSKELDNRHDWHWISLQEKRHLRPEDFLPVLLVAKEIDCQHRADGKEEGHVDVTRNVGATGEHWQKTNEVGGQDEEEHR